jgi:hypothetical protein
MEYVGFRIWYGDGTVKSNLDGPWNELPSQDVQFVTFYEMRTYNIWIETEWVTENYVVQLHSQDYYWLDADGNPGAGSATDVPELPQGAVKTGSWMLEETGVAFWNLAAEVQTVRIAP